MKCEPIEEMSVDCPDESAGTVIELATKRKGTLTNMESANGRTRLEFSIPRAGSSACGRTCSPPRPAKRS